MGEFTGVVARKGDEELVFGSMVACAAHFGVSASAIFNKVSRGTLLNGYSITRSTTRTKPRMFSIEEDDMPDREPIGIGYYVDGMIPCICPICKKVITGNVTGHLRKCLAGHTTTIKFGVIKVYD